MRRIGAVLFGLLLLALVGLGLAVQFRPALPARAAPDAESAGLTRDLAGTLRDVLAAEAARGEIALPLARIRALLTSAGRIQPGLRADAAVEDGRLVLRGSIGSPLLPGPLWLNPRLVVANSDRGFDIESASLGHLPIPPGLARRALEAGIDHVLGQGYGGVALRAIRGIDVVPEGVTLSYALSEEERLAFFTRVKERVRGFTGDADNARIYAHLWYLDRAGDQGRLPREGSALPYLRHVIDQAEGAEDMKAALLALTLYCGEDALGPAVGATLSPAMQGRRNHCDGTTLAGRDDLKRHFVVSAGIYAARSGDVAFGMGEFKELLDSNEGGSGFSFDDMAADLAGARFAKVALGTAPDARAALSARIATEEDVLPSLEGLPSGMPEAAFRARFGDVESPAYQAMIAEINARLDAMPLYQGTAGDG
jgi:hypothetical protein